MTLNLIPAIVDGYEKPVLTFYWDVFSLESRPVAENVERGVYAELMRIAGKPLDTVEFSDDNRPRNIRGPYAIEREGGTITVR